MEKRGSGFKKSINKSHDFININEDHKYYEKLEELGIIKKQNDGTRNKMYMYEEYVELFKTI